MSSFFVCLASDSILFTNNEEKMHLHHETIRQDKCLKPFTLTQTLVVNRWDMSIFHRSEFSHNSHNFKRMENCSKYFKYIWITGSTRATTPYITDGPTFAVIFDEKTIYPNSFLDIIISVKNPYSTSTDGGKRTLDDIYPHEFLSLKQYSTHNVKPYRLKNHIMYLTLTKSDRNKTLNFQLAMQTRINLREKLFLNSINLEVKYSLQMSNYNTEKFIALPGVLRAIKCITSNVSDNYTMKIYWLHDRYNSSGFQSKNCRHTEMGYNYCQIFTRVRNKFLIFWHVYNYSHWHHIPNNLHHTFPFQSHMKANYYNYEKRVVYNETLHQMLVDMTWIEASKFCKSIGGSLPLIRNKEELTDLITFLKLSHDMPPVNVLYIGLLFSKVENYKLKINNK